MSTAMEFSRLVLKVLTLIASPWCLGWAVNVVTLGSSSSELSASLLFMLVVLGLAFVFSVRTGVENVFV